MWKKIVSVCLMVTMLAALFVAPVSVGAENGRYIVLVVDTSEGSKFTSGGKTIYDASPALDYAKVAAKKFVEDTLRSGNNTYIAIVSYKLAAQVNSGFTNDANLLNAAIDGLYAEGKSKMDMCVGLEKAHELLNQISGEKNVVVFSTGMTFAGQKHSYSGLYDNTVIGNTWRIPNTGIHLYAYANAAIAAADAIKKDAKIYSVGLFQTLEGMPEKGKDIAEFFRLTARDIASSADYFYPVENPEDLNITFSTVAEDIQLNPSIWAKGEIKEAKEAGLIPVTLEGQDLSKKISRGEFAAVALELYEALSGQTVGSASSPFRDIAGNVDEDAINKAYDLNIVAGISSTEFRPDARISREDLAAMLCRAIKKYKFEDWSLATDNDYYLDSEGVKKFADDADISAYAKPSVYYLTKMGILNGVSETHFAPKNTTSDQEAQGYATATREQAIALSLRIFKISELLNVSQNK